MTEQKELDFLSSLEVGDEVAFGKQVYRGTELEPHFQFTTVAKITPSGLIKTKCGKTFNPDGRIRGEKYCALVSPEVARAAQQEYKQEQQAKKDEARKELHQLVDQIENLYYLERYVRTIKSELQNLKVVRSSDGRIY